MSGIRMEHDIIGYRELPADCYYGIHTLRAVENFPLTGRTIHPRLIQALAMVKKAATLTNADIGLLPGHIAGAIAAACDEIISGQLHEWFVVDALQGGAGTSANMNVNEVIANRAIELLGGQKGDYVWVHPNDHVNLSQSTNDVFPTAVRIAAIQLLKPVSEAFADLQTALQHKEEEFQGILKVGRTQLQDAVPVTLGQEFGAWAQAIARDRWRLYKVEERLRQVNLGGTAVGTGINARRKYIFRVVERLRDIAGIGLARAEYMMDPTQNNDVFVEVSGLIKAAAVNLTKIANDIRLLASGPRAGIGEIRLPGVQAGSSIMPGKVNPVIPEAVNQIAFQLMGNDMTITLAAQAGQLELNPFLPVIAHNLFEMLDLLEKGIHMFITRCITGIQANQEECSRHLEDSLVLATALGSVLGYEEAGRLAIRCTEEKKTVRQVLLEEGLLSADEMEKLLNPFHLTRPIG